MKMEIISVDSVAPTVALRSLAGIQPQNPSQLASTKGFVGGIMGLPTSGKTTSLLTLLPEHGPIAAFFTDGGGHVLEDIPGQLQCYRPNGWDQLDKMTDELAINPEPFKTIWVDVVTMVQEENVEFYGIHEMNTPRERQAGYGDSNFDVLKFHRKLMKLADTHGTNIFFVYWSSRPVVVEGSGNPVATRHIVLSPTLSLKVTGILDVILYMEVQKGLNPYPPVMTLQGDGSIESRVRLNPNNPLKKWPSKVPNPSLSKVVNAFHGTIYTNFSPE